MLKNAFFIKTITSVSLYSFMLASMPQPAHGWGLNPQSFNQMYNLAQNGDVEGLRASIYRGLNIDAVNADGDTGLCLAARRHDAYTYNSFRAAGANPHHPCTQNIDDYERFVSGSGAVPVTANSRAAYGAIGHEEYRVSPWVWWTLGGALVAGGLILAFSGGGGGGKGGNSSGGDSESYESLGAVAGQKGKILNTAVGANGENTAHTTHKNTATDNIKNINFNSNVLQNTDYLDVVFKADKKGMYTNTAGTAVQIGEGTVAMDALNESSVVNNGYINIDSYNASVGMVASVGSAAINNGKGANGIDMNFSGYNANNNIIGMYADTKSTATNNGLLKGTAIQASPDPDASNPDADPSAVTSSQGSIIGMEAMLINAGPDLSKDVIRLRNTVEGEINLSAGDGGSDTIIKVNMTGMGSYLDNGFMNGSLNINRAETANLMNEGNIILEYTGNYQPAASNALRKGTGGIVGMRADARTFAQNDGTIAITMHDDYDIGDKVDVAAAMQSIHGGNLTNKGNIEVVTPSTNNRISYGMLSVEGSGTVSGLYTNLNQELINNSAIKMEVSNSFGMASYNGGTLTNTGTIGMGKQGTTTLYKNNIAMYGYGKTKEATLVNTVSGIINLYSYESIAMQSDFSGGTVLTNDGTINVYRSATNSYIFGGSYSVAHNAGHINYYASTDKATDSSTMGTDEDPFANYNITLGNMVISTKGQTLAGEANSTSSSTENIYNDAGATLSMYGASFTAGMAVETTQGQAENNGLIEVYNSDIDNASNSVGMYLAKDTINTARITNNNSIITQSWFAAAMASDSANNGGIINSATGVIQSNFQYSLGMMASDKSYMHNHGEINMNADNSVAMYTRGDSMVQNFATGVINVGNSTTAVKNGYGIHSGENAKATITNAGNITVNSSNRGGGIYTMGEATVTNAANITMLGSDAYGMFASGNKAKLTNASGGNITIGAEGKEVENSYAMFASGDEVTLDNEGTIDLYSEGESYAIRAEGKDDVIINKGTINLHNQDSTAIYAEYGKLTNSSTINVLNDNSRALVGGEAAEITNDKNGVINVGQSGTPVKNSYGMSTTAAATDATVLTNDGTINLYSLEDTSYAMFAQGEAKVVNNKTINSYQYNSTAIMTNGTNTVTNTGDIIMTGSNVYAIRGKGEDSVLTALNDTNANITIGAAATSGLEKGYGIVGQVIDTITNRGTITIYNSKSYGIQAESGNKISNQGSIIMDGTQSVAISGGEVGEITNSSLLQLLGSKSKGIETSGANIITNTGTISLNNGNDAYGIYATGAATITNTVNGIINVGTENEESVYGYGIFAEAAKEIINNGAINIYSQGTGITGGDKITNTAALLVAQSYSKGIASNGSSIDNSGTITMKSASNSYGIYASEAATITNSDKGVIILGSSEVTGAQNGYGIYADKATSISNKAPITIFGQGTVITGGNTITNEGNLYARDNNSKGIATNGTSLTNSGAITIAGATNSYGIYATKAVNLTNNESASITLGTSDVTNALNANGIYADKASKIENAAPIIIYGQGTGITGGESIDNSGMIWLSRADSKGISSNGTTITNSGIINMREGNDSYGIFASGAANITNYDGGQITVGNVSSADGVGGYGIYGEFANSINNQAAIRIYGQGAAIVGGTAITNTANLYVTGANSNGIKSNGTSIDNRGSINLSQSDGSNGIYATGAVTITNNERGTITLGSRSQVGQAYNSNGIYATSANSIDNAAVITVYGQGTGITGAGNITNSGALRVADANSKGISSSGARVTNSAAITMANANNSYGIYATGSVTISNSENGIIQIGSADEIAYSNGYGIMAYNASSITNRAPIYVYASGAAISGKGTIDNSGSLLVTGAGKGISSSGGGNITNSGAIEIQEAIGSYGIYTTGQIGITNNEGGAIVIGSADFATSVTDAVGIYAPNATSVINSDSITVYAHSAYGINAGAATTINNQGKITLPGDVTIGIYSTGTANISNSKAIEMASGKGNYGIWATGSANITNANGSSIIIGTADATEVGTGNYGIYANAGNITNSGIIHLYDSGVAINGSAVSSITNTASGIITMERDGNTAISAVNATVNNSGTINVLGEISTGISVSGTTGTVTTAIGSLISAAERGSTGIFVDKATVTNAGSISVGDDGSYGVNSRLLASSLTNDGSIIAGDSATAVNGFGTVTNNGTIEVGNNSVAINNASTVVNNNMISVGSNSKGIVATDPTTITNSSTGTISVGAGGYGMYITVTKETSVVKIINQGQIIGAGTPIYIIKEYNLRYDEEGKMIKDSFTIEPGSVTPVYYCKAGGTCEYVEPTTNDVGPTEYSPASLIETSAPMALGQISLLNRGTLAMNDSDIDFGDADSAVHTAVGAGGQYAAKSFSGTVYADSSIVADGFADTYTNEDSFVGEDCGLNVVSDSYMFEAAKTTNEAGNTDVVMTIKSFADITDDAQVADYLADNYAAANGERVFRTLKSAGTADQYNDYIAQEFGFNLLPNLTKQSLDVERTVNRALTDDLFNVAATDDTRTHFDLLAYKSEAKAKGSVSGYEDNVEAAYGFYDKAVNNAWRAGLGLAVMRVDSDYDIDAARYNNVVELYAPLTFRQDNLAALIKPKAGFGRGHYRRAAVTDKHKADTKEYYYGVDTEARQTFDLTYLSLEPAIGFNLTGLYTDNIKESNGGARVKHKNIVSAQSVVGLTAQKKLELAHDQAVTLSAGGQYFHEFGNKYRQQISVADMAGYIDLPSDRFTRDQGLLSLKAKYEYNNFTLGAAINAPLAQKQKEYYILDLGYTF